MRLILAVTLFSAMASAQAPARQEFEVASVKKSPPPVQGQVPVGVHIDGAQVHCTFLSLRDYIRVAYKVKDYQIEGPDFMRTEKYDISAKLPSASARDQVAEMIQSLLEDRFALKFHRETKEFPVYALIVDKGGLKAKAAQIDADTGTVSVTANNTAAGTTVDLGKGAYFFLGDKTLEARKLTMAQTSDLLARFVDRPVVDMTDVPGTFDFTLELKPEEFLAMKIRAAIIAGVSLPPEALKLLDNANDDSLYAALAREGLKLERRKAPLEILVVDRVEKTPTEN
jgi:uncharacterized protein (TIGR03435 family)